LARLQKIDDLVRGDHYHLTPDDECYYWGEYTARKPYSFSDTNNLIINFKKSPLRRNRPAEWQHKERAIASAARFFRGALKPEAFTQFTLVPIPPSKEKGHPEYDDRLVRMLQMIGQDRQADIRELVIQTETIEAAHDAAVRPRPEDLVEVYEIDKSIALPDPRMLFVFDDVLTTGAHFKAMQQVLNERYPDIPVVGFFIARRVPDSSSIEDFEIIS